MNGEVGMIGRPPAKVNRGYLRRFPLSGKPAVTLPLGLGLQNHVTEIQNGAPSEGIELVPALKESQSVTASSSLGRIGTSAKKCQGDTPIHWQKV